MFNDLFKHKQRNMVWTKGTDALVGEFQSSSEVDFYLNQVYSLLFQCSVYSLLFQCSVYSLLFQCTLFAPTHNQREVASL